MIFSLSFYLVLIDDYSYYLYIVYNCVYVFSVPMSFGVENKDIYIYVKDIIGNKLKSSNALS
jgi:hypothetical protein